MASIEEWRVGIQSRGAVSAKKRFEETEASQCERKLDLVRVIRWWTQRRERECVGVVERVVLEQLQTPTNDTGFS
jgi:hypothetical protein